MTNRRENDFYPTSHRLTEELLKRVPLIEIANVILEPCVGDGAIQKVLIDKSLRVEVIGYDIDPRFGVEVADATKPNFWSKLPCEPDWTVTNPPFKYAHEIIPDAFKSSKVGIAMLLPTSWLQPAKGRGDWLEANEQNLSNLIVFGEPRPSFTLDGKTAFCTVCWMVWQKNWRGGCFVNFVRNWLT